MTSQLGTRVSWRQSPEQFPRAVPCPRPGTPRPLVRGRHAGPTFPPLALPTGAKLRLHAPGPAHMLQAPPLRIHLGLVAAQRFVRTVSTSGQIKSPKGEPPQTGAGPLLWEGGRRFWGRGGSDTPALPLGGGGGCPAFQEAALPRWQGWGQDRESRTLSGAGAC